MLYGQTSTVKRYLGTVLLVEDNPVIGVNQKDLLESEGYRCVWADSLQRAWRLAQTHSLELIICDHDLPDGKGETLVKRLLASGRSVPVLYLSAAAHGDLRRRIEGLESVRSVLTKPVSPEELMDAVKACAGPTETVIYPRLIGQDERGLLLNALA